MKASIRRLDKSEFSSWKDLWDQYLVFYETALPEEHSRTLFERITDQEDRVEALVAEIDGDLVGLVHFLPHDDTWDRRKICYLQDLFVNPSQRGHGIGESLIASVRSYAGQQGWSGVYWQTADDNTQARILYDKIAGSASGFIVYNIDVV